MDYVTVVMLTRANESQADDSRTKNQLSRKLYIIYKSGVIVVLFGVGPVPKFRQRNEPQLWPGHFWMRPEF